MPNWCSTMIKFYSENAEQVKEMQKKFVEIQQGEPTIENDFGHGFMGDYANVFFPEYGAEKMNCRGWVDGIDEVCENGKYTVFTMWTETAWGAKIGIWNEIVKKFYPDVKIAYVAEEPGCELFNVWDETEGKIFCPEDYYIDGCLPDKEGKCEYIDDRYCYGGVEEIFKFLDSKLPFEYKHTEDLSELSEEVQAKLDEFAEKVECDESVYFYATRFIEVSPDEYDAYDW